MNIRERTGKRRRSAQEIDMLEKSRRGQVGFRRPGSPGESAKHEEDARLEEQKKEYRRPGELYEGAEVSRGAADDAED
jgi:hypothetical protein